MRDLPASDTRSSLLMRLQDREEMAWREFFEIYTPMVFGYALRRGLQANDAEDVSQEVLVEVARCIGKFEYQPEMGRFRDWLETIAWRRIARHWNSAKKSAGQLAEECVGGRQTDPEWVDEFHGAILKAAIEMVRPRFAEITWRAFEAVWSEGEPAASVARRLEIPIEVVYNAKYRILKQLEAEVLRISDDCAWIPNPQS